MAGLVFAAHAQEFQKGTNIISAGVGLGSSILSYSGASQSPATQPPNTNGAYGISAALASSV